jgi:hypothetical protein
MISIAIWGEHAARFVARHRCARVAGVFARSLHLEARGDFLCLGEASIGHGPLNAVLEAGHWALVAKSLPPQGTGARISDGAVRIGPIVIGTAAARSWRPPPWPSIASCDGLVAAVEGLERLTRDRAPADGLARIVLGSGGEPASVLAGIARPRVARLRHWLSARLARPLRRSAPVDLVGLGPGLTPSGDDLLCGAMVALRAVGQPGAARDLHAAIDRSAPAATTALCRAFLRAAAEGHGSEALHAALAALIENRISARHLEALARIGHTSGWDTLAGALLVLQALSSIAGHPCPLAQHMVFL